MAKKVLFVEYPKCTTCKKAKAWLDEQGIEHEDRHIVEDNPSAEELKRWHKMSELPIRRLFNTSGQFYRQRNIKALLDEGLSDDEAYKLLAENGMLVKRPILVTGETAFFGFKEPEYKAALGLGD